MAMTQAKEEPIKIQGTTFFSDKEAGAMKERITRLKDKYPEVKKFSCEKMPFETKWEDKPGKKSDLKYQLTVSFVVAGDPKTMQRAEELEASIAKMIGQQRGPVERVWERDEKKDPKEAVASRRGQGPTFGNKEW